MKSNSSAESALHITLLLAATPKGREVAAADLADFHALSRGGIAKLLIQLAAAGIVASSSGRKGGYSLAKAAGQISVYDVASAVDGVEPRFHCHEIRRAGPCAGSQGQYSPRCAIARAMDGATLAWRNALTGVTIADLVAGVSADVSPTIQASMRDWIASHSR
jgi:Rrf2 family protein